LHFKLLIDEPHFIKTIAKWYVEEWRHLVNVESEKAECEKLKSYLNRSEFPLIVLAVECDQLLGCVQLKFREMTIYPEREHWLGGVYIYKPQRGKGLAKKLIWFAIEKARKLNVSTLYLQTEQLDGGLYAQIGWQPIDQVDYEGHEVLVMKLDID